MSLPTFYVPSDPSDPHAIPLGAIPADHTAKFLAAGAEMPTAEYVKPVKLGRKAPARRANCLQFSDYINRLKAQPLPDSCDHLTKALPSVRQMLGNGGPNGEGDCVIASTLHGIGITSGNDTGTPILSSDSEALSEYHRIGGPGDNGLVISDTLDFWMSSGIRCGGSLHKLDGYLAINPADQDAIKRAILVFGSMRVGFSVPASYMNTPDGGVWGRSNSQRVGGHDVHGIDFGGQVVGWTAEGLRIATWAGTRIFAWDALADTSIADEAYVELLPEWYGNDGLAPNEIKVDALKAALAAWKQGQIPPWGGDSPPPPPPSPPSPPVPTKPLRLSGTFKSGLWGTPYDTILTQLPDSGLQHPVGFGLTVPIWTFIFDCVRLASDAWARNIPAAIVDLQKIAADLGITLAHDRARVIWSNLFPDVTKLVEDVLAAWKTGVPLSTLVADLKAVFIDLTTSPVTP
jgi:hypothetical protein